MGAAAGLMRGVRSRSFCPCIPTPAAPGIGTPGHAFDGTQNTVPSLVIQCPGWCAGDSRGRDAGTRRTPSMPAALCDPGRHRHHPVPTQGKDSADRAEPPPPPVSQTERRARPLHPDSAIWPKDGRLSGDATCYFRHDKPAATSMTKSCRARRPLTAFVSPRGKKSLRRSLSIADRCVATATADGPNVRFHPNLGWWPSHVLCM